jgi:hypothetical protein
MLGHYTTYLVDSLPMLGHYTTYLVDSLQMLGHYTTYLVDSLPKRTAIVAPEARDALI